jgi:hypothetical protein
MHESKKECTQIKTPRDHAGQADPWHQSADCEVAPPGTSGYLRTFLMKNLWRAGRLDPTAWIAIPRSYLGRFASRRSYAWANKVLGNSSAK